MGDIKEDECWLASAHYVIGLNGDGTEKYTVSIAQSIHSIIKSNDALTMKFFGKRAIKHHEIPEMFLDLVRQNKIPDKFADLRKTVLRPAIETKSKADYKGLKASKSDAELWARHAEKFLKSAKESLEQ